MSYRVHRHEVDLKQNEGSLENFLNRLDGEIIAVFPHVRRPNLAWIYGIQRSVDFVVVVERVA